MYLPDLNKDKLLERLKFSMTKKEVLQLAKSFSNSGVGFEEIISLTLHKDQPISFHSAWVLENMFITSPEALDYYLPTLIDNLPKAKNHSVQRHLTKLISLGVQRVVKRKTSKVIDREFWQTNLEPLEEICFKWLVDEKSKPAIKANCMDVLFHLSLRQKWIAQELPYIIENQMEMGTPALRAKGKKVLMQLKEKI
jgi:hypothetical protein